MRVPRGHDARGLQSVIPRHVAACAHSKIPGEKWAVWFWRKEEPDKQHRRAYECGSWRCEVCRRREAAVTFARIKQACDPLPADGWVFLVLTIDRNGYFGGPGWSDVNHAYRELSRMTRAVLGRIGRGWGPEVRTQVQRKAGGRVRTREVRTVGNRWVSVVEAHRSGWPHVNLLVWCPSLAAQLRLDREAVLQDPLVADAVALSRDAWSRREPVPASIRELARKAALVSGAVAQIVVASGWGLQSTAEAAQSSDAVAGYLLKLAGKHDASTGELAKITQAPMNAPERFRRLRSGKGFLPPRYKDANVTGCLLRRRVSAQGDWELVGMNAPKDPLQQERVQRAINAEYQLIDEEEGILSRGKRLPAMPPLRRAVVGVLEPHRVTSERRSAISHRQRAAEHGARGAPGAPQFMSERAHDELVARAAELRAASRAACA